MRSALSRTASPTTRGGLTTRTTARRLPVALLAAAPLLTAAPLLALGVPAASAAQVTHASVVSPAPSRATPNVANGAVYDIAQAGGRTFLGGSFTSATSTGSTTAVPRARVLSFDAAGVLDAGFAPVLNKPVNALLPGPTPGTLYVGGAFTTMNGVAVRRLVLLDTATGKPVPGFLAPVLNGVVNDVKRVGDRLYVGGTFTKVGSAPRTGLITLNATTGALDPYASLTLAGNHSWTPSSPSTDAKAPVGVTRLDVDAAGRHLVAVGNFKTVNGTDRDQVLLADLTGPAAALADWHTDRFDSRCYANAYDSWVRDVELSPDGSYFVVVATGGYPGGEVLCDAASRWETAARGTGLQPTWVDWTGGDSLLSVAVTDTAVYVGGHQRWLNNVSASDRAGQGAVARPGLGALDPLTGVPLSWNPGRNPRGVGAGALLATPDGLFVGSDTDQIGVGRAKTVRRKIALFPLAGGRPAAGDAAPALPATVVQSGATSRYGVLHRINEGGPTLASVDAGPDWLGDAAADAPALRNSGSSTATSGTIANRGVLPPGAPTALFDTERWDPSGGEELTFRLPVPTTAPLTVRLYFANRYSGTSQVGTRVFDIDLEGTRVRDAYDIVRKVGDQTGTYEEFSLPAQADGKVDLVLRHHGADNPTINGIEVLDATAAPVPAAGSDDLTTRSFTGTTAGPATTSAGSSSPGTAGVAWRDVRGAFVAGGSLYYGSAADGTLHRRALDGSSDVSLNPYHDPLWDAVANGSGGTYAGNVPDLYGQLRDVTTMFYDQGRIYYALSGRPGLYSRAFSTDSGIVGSSVSTVDTSRDWSDTRGAFVAGGTLYFARTDGNLWSTGWSHASAVPGQPVAGRSSGTPSLVSGTGDWAGRGMWLSTP